MTYKIATLVWIKKNSLYSGDYWCGLIKCNQAIFQIRFVEHEDPNSKYEIFVCANFLECNGNEGYEKYGQFDTLKQAQDKCQELFESAVKENFLQQ